MKLKSLHLDNMHHKLVKICVIIACENIAYYNKQVKHQQQHFMHVVNKG
jgi:DNA-binding transcriptional regulator of glucitol operon